jgi:glutathione S-transferase
MAIVFYCGSGSPYAWRVWLALEHKGLPYELRMLSFDRGDVKQPAFVAMNPRGQVPVIQDGDYILYESAAIVEYLEDAYPGAGAPLLPDAPRSRGLVRRLVREADEYLFESVAGLLEQVLFVPQAKWSDDAILKAREKLLAELPRWQRLVSAATGGAGPFLAGAVGAADFTAYPFFALTMRAQRRRPSLELEAALGPHITEWMRRVEALPYFDRTYPPHWRA